MFPVKRIGLCLAVPLSLLLCLTAPRSPGAEGGASVAELIQALGDADALVREQAAVALGRKGPAEKAAVPALQKALTDASADVRAAADAALKQIAARPSRRDELLRIAGDGKE